MRTLQIGWIDTDNGRYLDFLISGKSVFHKLERSGVSGYVTHLGSGLTPISSAYHDELLLRQKGILRNGRVALYGCPCGDYGCGVVSVEITREGDDFVWSRFGRENDYDGKLTLIERIGPFRFTGENYRQALSISRSPEP